MSSGNMEAQYRERSESYSEDKCDNDLTNADSIQNQKRWFTRRGEEPRACWKRNLG